MFEPPVFKGCSRVDAFNFKVTYKRRIKRVRILILAILAVLLLPALAFGAGGHDSLGCTGCHGIHNAETGQLIFAVKPNKKAVDPKTKKAYTGITALCLGCHEDTGGMGIMPIKSMKSHPYGVKPNPKVAAVPASLLRNGKLECIGCHDPHPSNPNSKYLRVGGNMQNFCSLCHSSKSGKKVSGVKIFSSMNESGSKPATRPAAKKPAKKR
jgi:predicted CXXCH cytochrome family protein